MRTNRRSVAPYYDFDEFLRRRRLIAEYTAHRVLAGHVPYERCAECDRILATFNANTQGQRIADDVFTQTRHH